MAARQEEQQLEEEEEQTQETLNRPRLEFIQDDKETATNGSITSDNTTVAYSSLLLSDSDDPSLEHHLASRVHEARHEEAKDRPSITSTAGRGVFARYHDMNRDTGSFTFKVILLGDASVGKTCLARLYVDRKVHTSPQSTIAFDCKTKELIIDGVPSTLQLWDTAGMEQFRRGLVNQYYRNLDGSIFVYDITKRESFEHLEDWFSEMRQYSRTEEGRIKCLLLGNKSDLEDHREVSIEEGRAFAEAHGMLFSEITAKSNDCLNTLDTFIERLSQQMLVAREENSLVRSMHDVIRLEGHLEAEWVIVDEIPSGPYSQFDNNRPKSAILLNRHELSQSFKRVLNKTRSRTASNAGRSRTTSNASRFSMFDSGSFLRRRSPNNNRC